MSQKLLASPAAATNHAAMKANRVVWLFLLLLLGNGQGEKMVFAEGTSKDGSNAVIRVALIDFTTEDNSYRSFVAARDFTATILASMMLPAMAQALRKARGLADHLGNSTGVQMQIQEVIVKYTPYRAAHPNHSKLSRKAFVHELQLSAAAEAWLNLKSVEYVPFAGADPTNQAAIIVYPSPGTGSGDRLVVFRISDLIAR